VPGHRGNAALTAVSGAAGHEIALHTESLWQSAEAEREAVEAVLGERVQGSSAHGDPTCFRFQGAPNVLWAEQQGLAYTELISHAHSHPHRVGLLGADGEITLSRTLCLPHHASFDRSMKEGDVLADQVAAEAARLEAIGGLLQILNHPDVNVEPLFGLLPTLPREGRWDVPAAKAVAWWAATHVGGAIRAEVRADGELVALADHDVRGAQVEIRAPGGAVTVSTVSLPAAGRVVLGSA
jgi:hypothetical protein